MNENNYKKVMQKIDVPSALKAKTLAEMKKREQAMECNKPLFNRGWAIVLAAVVLVLTIGVSVRHKNMAESIFKTPVGTEHVAYVELEDGYLNFADSSSVEGNTPNMGLINPLQKKWSMSEYEAYLERNPVLTLVPTGFNLSNNEITAKFKMDGSVESVTGNFLYKNTEGASINLVLSDVNIAAPVAINRDIVSVVNDIEINVAYDSGKDMYCALFLNEGQNYMLSSESLGQKEFIEVLYNLVK